MLKPGFFLFYIVFGFCFEHKGDCYWFGTRHVSGKDRRWMRALGVPRYLRKIMKETDQ